jgi:hypothetical protein
MLILSSLITIVDPTGNLSVDIPIISIEIDKSRKTLTNTAKIEMPRSVMLCKPNGSTFSFAQTAVNSIIQRGASVTIQIGYDGNLVTEFTGFIAHVSADIPVVIKCQDSMWTLKQNSFTHTWPKGVRVSDIISFIYPGLAVVVDLTIGGLVVVKQSTAQILEGLKKFGLQCYFDVDAFGNNLLIVDFAGVVHTHGKEVIYDFYGNIISNDLEYKLKEDARIKVVAVSKLANGQKIQIVAGDNDGEVHTLHYANMDQDQLQKIVTAEIGKLKYEGYTGTFRTFGLPLINPGDIAYLQDGKYPEHDGSYLAESVKTTFGVKGFRREITLERKLS